MWNLVEDKAFKRDKCLRNSNIFEGVGVRVIEGIDYTKYTIYIISLIIK